MINLPPQINEETGNRRPVMLSLLGKEEKPKEATKEGAKNGETSTESATAKTGTVKPVLTDTSVKRTPPYYRHSISVPSYFAIFYV